MKNILCFGDSNTYGYNPLNGLRYPREIRWTGRLQMLLGQNYRVIEEGCNGRTSVFVDEDEPWKCGINGYQVVLNTHKPVDMIVMMLGSNDLKNYFHASAEEIAAGVETLVKKMKDFAKEKQGFEPEFLLIAPPIIRKGIERTAFGNHFDADAVTRSQAFGRLYQEVADRNGCIFWDSAEWITSSEKDCLHLMPECHAIMAEQIFQKIKGYRIRKTRLSDMETLRSIYRYARNFMVENGNPNQWTDGYPSKEILLEDIQSGDSYVYEEDGQIHGTFVLKIGEDQTYSYIEDGEWISNRPYGTIHRIASDGQVRGLLSKCVEFCESVIPHLRIDTHKDNLPMRAAIAKNGFKYCGIIYVRDHSPRVAFEKIVSYGTDSLDYELLIQYLLEQKATSIQKSHFEIVSKRTQMTDFAYEKLPDAEIGFINGEGQHLYAFAYEATAYQEYGILDISWLDHDFEGGEVDKAEHQLESYDSIEDALESPYVRLYLELKSMLENAEFFIDEEEEDASEYF